MAISNLNKTIINEEVLSTLKSRLAPLGSMTLKFSPKYDTTLRIPVISDVATVQKNATSYKAQCGATASYKDISMDEYSLTLALPRDSKNGGWNLANFVRSMATQFGNQICKEILSKLPVPGTKTVPVVANYTGKDLVKLNTLESDEVFALLEKSYFNQIVPTDKNGFDNLESGAFGYQGVNKIVASQLPSTVVNAIYGKGAIGIAMARPYVEDSETVEFINIGSAETGDLEIAVKTWVDDDSSTSYICMKVMLGAEVLDADLVATYKSATA